MAWDDAYITIDLDVPTAERADDARAPAGCPHSGRTLRAAVWPDPPPPGAATPARYALDTPG